MSDFGSKVLDYHFNLPKSLNLTDGVEMLYPFDQFETIATMRAFFTKYYQDSNGRHFIYGINPGRFGSGITGVGFSDPLHLEKYCDIKSNFAKRVETSAAFIFEVIVAYGGVEKFYSDFYITSVSPVGFVKEGKNYNYYDDKGLSQKLEPFIIDNIQTQMGFGAKSREIVCIGQGQNLKYLQKLSDTYDLFDKIYPLPHPRWVMQYRRKTKQVYIDQYLEVLNAFS
ncbi:MAG: DUF4918 family protein [Epsilonproteobacteria bacterium]|nr:DUF4918 family protein [Campylobacterota bacterium]